MNIIELTQTFSFEISIDVSDKNLCSFVEMDLVAFVDGVVLEVGEAGGEDGEEADGRVVGGFYDVREETVEVLDSDCGDFVEDSGSLGDQGDVVVFEYFLFHNLRGNCGHFVNCQSSSKYSILHTLCQKLVLHILILPETEVHGIKSKQVGELLLFVELDVVALETMELSVLEVLDGLDFLLVDFDVL